MNRECESSKAGIVTPARVLLIDQDPAFAAGVREVMGRRAPAQVWLWHERTPELALTLLSVCEFDLILLTLPSLPSSAARLVHAIAETALGRSLLLLKREEVEWGELDRMPAGVVGVVSRERIDEVCQAIAQALGQPARAEAVRHALAYSPCRTVT